jgi:hypothetical protein
MQPTTVELLRGVVVNFEELILPDLKPGHAASAGSCIRMVLNHIILRLEQEPQVLLQDIAEKRALFAQLVEQMDRDPKLRGIERLSSLSGRMAALAKTTPATGYVPVGDLVALDDEMKTAVSDLIEELHAQRDAIGEAFDTMREPIRLQLRAQMDREIGMVAPAMDGPMF